MRTPSGPSVGCTMMAWWAPRTVRVPPMVAGPRRPGHQRDPMRAPSSRHACANRRKTGARAGSYASGARRPWRIVGTLVIVESMGALSRGSRPTCRPPRPGAGCDCGGHAGDRSGDVARWLGAPHGDRGEAERGMTITQNRWAWLPLGQMLVNDKVLTPDQLNEALDRQRKTRERLGQILIDMKLIDEDMLLNYLGAQFRKEPITRQDLASLDADVVRLVPEAVARQYGVIAAQRSGRRLVVATADPLNVVALDDLRRATGLEVDFRIGPASAIQDAIEKCYRRAPAPPTGEGLDDTLDMDLGLSVELTATTPSESTVDIRQLQSQTDDPRVVRVVQYV